MYCVIEFILKYFLNFFKEKIKDAFSKGKRKDVEKNASVTGFFNKTCVVPVLNIFDKVNNLNPIKISQVSLKNFSSFKGIHYSVSFLNSRKKTFPLPFAVYILST